MPHATFCCGCCWCYFLRGLQLLLRDALNWTMNSTCVWPPTYHYFYYYTFIFISPSEGIWTPNEHRVWAERTHVERKLSNVLCSEFFLRKQAKRHIKITGRDTFNPIIQRAPIHGKWPLDILSAAVTSLLHY